READVVAVNATLASGQLDAGVGASATAEAFDEKLGWVRVAAGERLAAIELQCHCPFTRVGDGETAPDIPLALGGSVDQVCATIAKHARAGEPVTVVLMTSGERTASMVASDPVAARARREGEARAACTAVGLAEDDLVFLRLPEGGIGLDGRAALVAALSAAA